MCRTYLPPAQCVVGSRTAGTYDALRTRLDLRLEPGEVALPDVAQDRPRDERAHGTAEPPREAQRFDPRELCRAAASGELEAAGTLHRTLMGNRHRVRWRPLGDREHVARVQRADARHAHERGVDAMGALGEEF